MKELNGIDFKGLQMVRCRNSNAHSWEVCRFLFDKGSISHNFVVITEELKCEHFSYCEPVNEHFEKQYELSASLVDYVQTKILKGVTKITIDVETGNVTSSL